LQNAAVGRMLKGWLGLFFSQLIVLVLVMEYQELPLTSCSYKLTINVRFLKIIDLETAIVYARY
jgi:hypothetical protein